MSRKIKSVEEFRKMARQHGKTYAELQQEETNSLIMGHRYKEDSYADNRSNRKGNR